MGWFQCVCWGFKDEMLAKICFYQHLMRHKIFPTYYYIYWPLIITSIQHTEKQCTFKRQIHIHNQAIINQGRCSFFVVLLVYYDQGVYSARFFANRSGCHSVSDGLTVELSTSRRKQPAYRLKNGEIRVFEVNIARALELKSAKFRVKLKKLTYGMQKRHVL